ncbi:MAG: hypothetical protein J6R77_03615, partial [Clostridia bacterium]|nr:hypothetical protein [Clostridia bacterium]
PDLHHCVMAGEKPRRGGFGLLAVQSISCAAVVLAVLILRLVGGNLFTQLGAYFKEAMHQNALTAAIHALWEEDIAYTTTTTTTSATTTTGAETTTTVPTTVPDA